MNSRNILSNLRRNWIEELANKIRREKFLTELDYILIYDSNIRRRKMTPFLEVHNSCIWNMSTILISMDLRLVIAIDNQSAKLRYHIWIWHWFIILGYIFTWWFWTHIILFKYKITICYHMTYVLEPYTF